MVTQEEAQLKAQLNVEMSLIFKDPDVKGICFGQH